MKKNTTEAHTGKKRKGLTHTHTRTDDPEVLVGVVEVKPEVTLGQPPVEVGRRGIPLGQRCEGVEGWEQEGRGGGRCWSESQVTFPHPQYRWTALHLEDRRFPGRGEGLLFGTQVIGPFVFPFCF